MPFSTVDINEDKLLGLGEDILNILLSDKTTRKNIIWATEDYRSLGEEYHSEFPMTVDLITGGNANVIQPRITKAKRNQANRTKEKAEVFTPAWICNEQNNLIDNAWFGRENVFNIPQYKAWKTNNGPIPFQSKKGARWQDYVDAKRIEITCGEAPYLTSRYDMCSGNYIDIPERIGLLDRKLRVISENTVSVDDWLKWAFRALESIYGFEIQGDNLFIARENIFHTFIENMQYKFKQYPGKKELKRAANIISWNIWQMDGLTYTVPLGTIEEEKVYCKIHDWRSKKTLLFKSLVENKRKQNGEHR